MKPTIQHYSRTDIAAGFVSNVNTKEAILIQIKTPEDSFVKPYQEFQQIFQFSFHDAIDEAQGFQLISDADVSTIAWILQNAYIACCDVVVHCDAGISRSAAVAVAGESIGFKLIGNKFKNPNSLILNKLRKELQTELFDPTKSAFCDDLSLDPYIVL